VILKLPAEAVESAKKPKATRIPVWIRTVFIEDCPKRGDEPLTSVQQHESRRRPMMGAMCDGQMSSGESCFGAAKPKEGHIIIFATDSGAASKLRAAPMRRERNAGREPDDLAKHRL
jgi:hypothetical protein